MGGLTSRTLNDDDCDEDTVLFGVLQLYLVMQDKRLALFMVLGWGGLGAFIRSFTRV